MKTAVVILESALALAAVAACSTAPARHPTPRALSVGELSRSIGARPPGTRLLLSQIAFLGSTLIARTNFERVPIPLPSKKAPAAP